MKVKVAYLLSNPIQYQEPLLRYLAQDPIIELTVIYRSRRSLSTHSFSGFNMATQWDIPLLDGYQYYFLNCLGEDKKFTFWRPFNYGLWSYLRKHRFDVLWIHGYKDSYLLYAVIIAKCLGVKVLVRGESTLQYTKQSPWKEKFRRPFFTILNKLVAGFLAIGTLNKRFYQYYDIPEKKLFWTPYTVDNERFKKQSIVAKKLLSQLKTELNITENVPVILYASSMMVRKHPEDLLEAFIRLTKDGKTPPQANLLFVGDGEQRAVLEARVKKLGWDNIKIVGFKNQTELPKYYALADIFVLPSENETWGLVVNEAMNAGCAVIVSDQVGSGSDLVKSGYNGEVFPARNIEELVHILQKLLANNELVKLMGSHSKEIISTWSVKETAAGIKMAVQTVMNK